VEIAGFPGPKSKNLHGGSVLDDTDVSGWRRAMSKMGRKTARAGCAMWHGRAVLNSGGVFSGG